MPDTLKKLTKAVLEGEDELAEELTQNALGKEFNPLSVSEAVMAGIQEAGRLWKENIYFQPDIIMSAEAFRVAMEVIEPHLSGGRGDTAGRVLIGTVAGDIHNLAKIKMLEEVLLPAAQSAGIENVIVDTGVLDVVGVSWAAVSIRNVKEKLGLPAGCAPANSIYSWTKMKARGTPAFEAAASSILALVKSQGADFLFYGSISNASWIYPCMATADALMAYAGRFNNVRPAIQEHPLYKIF